MLYSFDDAETPDRHTTQYFELTGTRAIYHEVVGRHAPRPGRPGRLGQHGALRPGRLGALRHDHGLRPRHRPGRRAPRETRRATGNLRSRGPQVQRLPTRRQHPRAAVRRAPKPRLRQQGQLPPGHDPDPRGRRHQHQEPLVHAHRGDRDPGGDAEGVLVTVGGETGGYALTVQDAKPTFHYNWLGRERYTIASEEPLPTGPCTIRFDFAYDGGGAGKGGTGTLWVNDKEVAEGRIEKTVPVVFSTDDTFDVGEDRGTPVSPTYQPPFRFTGNLKQVTVEAKECGVSRRPFRFCLRVRGAASCCEVPARGGLATRGGPSSFAPVGAKRGQHKGNKTSGNNRKPRHDLNRRTAD